MAVEQQTRDAELDYASNALRQRGILPDAAGEYTEDLLMATIASRGWVSTIRGGPGDWSVEIDGEVGNEPFRFGTARDPDRTTALVRALGIAVGWVNPKEARQIFDREARQLLGMTGDEFLRRWDAGEFDPEDPNYRMVVHMSMLSSFGRAKPE